MKLSLPLYRSTQVRAVCVGLIGAVAMFALLFSIYFGSYVQWVAEDTESATSSTVSFWFLMAMSFLIGGGVCYLFSRMSNNIVSGPGNGTLRPEAFVSLREEAERVYGVSLSAQDAENLLEGVTKHTSVPLFKTQPEFATQPVENFVRYGEKEKLVDGTLYRYQLVWMEGEYCLLDTGIGGVKELPRKIRQG